MNNLLKFFYGIIARALNSILSVKSKCWVFGADYGKSYREGSKYLIEFMDKYHKDFTCVFITSSKQVINEVRAKGIKCYSNYSLKGIYYLCVAENVFTCQYLSDLDYTFKKRGRNFYYLLHGMPYKLAMNALPTGVLEKSNSLLFKIKLKVSNILIKNYTMEDVRFISVTSEFLVPFAKKDFSQETDVRVLGMPRNDGLFDNERMKNERWIKGIEDKIIITYMPTHRKYGAGEPSPSLFIENEERVAWLRDHNAVVLIKQHPNMASKLKNIKQNDVIMDITSCGLDPQVCIYHTDVLITDYSSVWMDYLLLKRPILFYYYDNFECDDAGTHYRINEIKPGHFCFNEDELFDSVMKTIIDYDSMRPSDSVINKFHKYIDGDSCKRYYEQIVTN